MPKKYPKVYEAEWVKPHRKYYKMMCCDCGLVHKFEFKLIDYTSGKGILFRAWRDNVATANTRRRKTPRKCQPK